ncbi:MAG TPA: universal stress protein [Candidatus Limnocylindrales bacterium]
MRVLLAIDGSVSSDRARDLVAGIEWPEGTIIRVVAALERAPELTGVPWMAPVAPDESEVEGSLIRRYQTALEAAERALEATGRGVQAILLRGRAASAVVEEARDFDADLIVVGNRGHGQFETMLLGSVSAEIVDQAPCPVLVARSTRIRSALLADDGSEGAEEAGELLASWPIFAGLRVTVTSVSEVAVPWSAGMAPGLYDQVMESYSENVQEARREVAAIVSATADRLANAGLVTAVEVRDGDPATCLVKAATELGVDLVVCGTRGLTGLSRLLIGSVARNVLLHAPCSVLIVRRHSFEGRGSAKAEAATGATA